MSDARNAALVDLMHLWRVDPVGHTEALLDVATTLHSAGNTSPTLDQLVADGPGASRGGVHRLVTALAAELGLDGVAGEAAQEAALGAAARRFVAGHITPRELTYWVTRVIGLRGGERGRVFLQLEQEYCDRLNDPDVTDIDVRVRNEAEALAEGRRSPSAGPEKRGLRGLFRRR